jgi:hypothetical protein
MSFKNLNLDRSLVEEFLAEASKSGNLTKSASKGAQTNYEFVFDGKKCLLIIYYNKDGTSTIMYKTGPDHLMSEAVATQIVERSKISDLKQAVCTFRNVDGDYFGLFPDFLEQELQGATYEKRSESPVEVQFLVRGISGDQVSLKYYKTTGTVLLQGKPLPIFNIVKLFFYEIVSEENIIEVENETYTIKQTVQDYRSSLRKYLPNSYSFLDDKIKKILTPALTLDSINIDLEDYSMFCFPSLRGLEGYTRQLLKKSYSGYSSTHKIGAIFTEKNSTFFLSDHAAKDIKCEKTIEAIEKSYNFWQSKRHPYFHIDKNFASAPIIESKQAAQALNVEVFDLIESTYCQIP